METVYHRIIGTDMNGELEMIWNKNLPGESEKPHENPQSGESMSRFEPDAL
jgi:hypothetical protein